MQAKAGELIGGWSFNEDGLTFNSATDPLSGDIVYFNGVGTAQTWTNQAQS